jgi:hypothetical protein
MEGAVVPNRYRCYFLEVDRIAALCLMECDNDPAAVIEAKQILESAPCTTVEVWNRDRRVSIVSKRRAAA